jgi:lipopolysaccharide transport system ATP-binding protein
MSEPVITVNSLSKRYRIGLAEQRSETLAGQIMESIKYPIRNFRKLTALSKFKEEESKDIFWALRDISFNVQQGEVLGVIGHNGAGKSTLLKVLSRITEPTSGEITIKGRVSSLLEVGTGFHPELTGRENVYMNGTILGMTKREIKSKFDEIVEFSGVEQYIDTPVKRYSSGMKVRLGFSVAAHLEPEILIVDEVLAVGDLGFQRKCLGMMKDVSRTGRTVIFVSHTMPAIENLCTSGLLLHQGKVSYLGPVKETVKRYVAEFRPEETSEFLSGNVARSGNGKIQLTSFFLTDHFAEVINTVQSGSSFNLKFGYRKTSDSELKNIDIGFSVHDPEDESLLFILYSSYTGRHYEIDHAVGFFECRIESLPLPEGRFLIKAQIMENGQVADFPHHGVGYLDVLDGDFYGTGVKSNKLTRERPRLLLTGNWN